MTGDVDASDGVTHLTAVFAVRWHRKVVGTTWSDLVDTYWEVTVLEFRFADGVRVKSYFELDLYPRILFVQRPTVLCWLNQRTSGLIIQSREIQK